VRRQEEEEGDVRFVAMSGVWWRKTINRRGAAARTRSDGREEGEEAKGK
jgi:hypothetical protein